MSLYRGYDPGPTLGPDDLPAPDPEEARRRLLHTRGFDTGERERLRFYRWMRERGKLTDLTEEEG